MFKLEKQRKFITNLHLHVFKDERKNIIAIKMLKLHVLRNLNKSLCEPIKTFLKKCYVIICFLKNMPNACNWQPHEAQARV